MIEIQGLAESPEIRAAAALVAVALLVAGRQLFWLAVATLGFAAGAWVASELLGEQPLGPTLILATVAGALGALAAVTLQKVAVAAAGFALGAVATRGILETLAVDLGRTELLAVLAGGVLAALAALALFSVALAVVTAGAGAALLAEALLLPPQLGVLLFLGLWVVGSALQLRGGTRERRKR